MVSNAIPVIIIGMHRSGTSMLARILEEHGLFLGKNRIKNVNNESRFFHGLNDWVFRQSGATWDNPGSVRTLIGHEPTKAAVVGYICHLLRTPRSASYLGWWGYTRYRTPEKLAIPWGWKDPRNTFTLPIWLDIFPGAKIISIHRHGVDVANSLRLRSQKQLEEFGTWIEDRKRRMEFERRRLPVKVISLKCVSLEEAFKLWEVYTRQADEHLMSLPLDRAVTVRYEDVLASPADSVADLCAFCGLEPDKEALARTAMTIDDSRSRAYLRDPQLVAFYRTVAHSHQMNKYGYGE